MGGEERTARRDVHLHIANRTEVGVMTTDDHVVFVVDDDARVREALSELLESHGIRAVTFGSAGEYVRADKPDLPASLILDVESAGYLRDRSRRHPVICARDQGRRGGFSHQTIQRRRSDESG